MPELIVKLGDQIVAKYFLYQDVMTVGRAPDNDLTIENLAISRKHLCIRRQDGRYILEDLNSSNGTFVNGAQVTKKEIFDKDVISVGKHKIYFYDQEQSAPAPSDMNEKTMMVSSIPVVSGVLRVLQGKNKEMLYPLDRAETRIGRAPDNDIVLADWFVSKHHAVIRRKDDSYILRDLESWRHTYVNGAEVTDALLRPGDEVQFGPKVAMIFELSDASARKPNPATADGKGADAPLPLARQIMPDMPAEDGVSAPHDPLADVAAVTPGSTHADDSDEPVAGDFDPAEEAAHEPDASAAGEFGSAPEIPLHDEEDSLFYDEESDIFLNISSDESARLEEADAENDEEDEPHAGPLGTEEAVISAFRSMSEAAANSGDQADPEAAAEAGMADANEPDREEASSYDVLDESLGEDADDESHVESISESGIENSLEAYASLEDPASEAFAAGQDRSEADEKSGAPSAESGQPAGALTAEEDVEAAGKSSENGLSAPRNSKNSSAESPAETAQMNRLIDEIMCNFEGDALDRKEVEMWVRALHNPSQLIRKQAQRKLKKLTGQTYEFPS